MTVTGPPVVIVGGGTAGCTVAAHLAAHTTREIVLIEPGPMSPHDDHPAFFDIVSQETLTRTIDVRVRSGQPPRAYLEAKALGGGSAINGMILSGDPPPELEAFTRLADVDNMGPVATALMAAGGEPARLWWNGGRWNPGRAVAHLVDEGRISIASEPVRSIAAGTRSAIVRSGSREIEARMVVMCAGAIATPSILLASGFGKSNPAIGIGLQNHPATSVVLHLRSIPDRQQSSGRFDASVLRRDRDDDGRDILTLAYERASADSPHLGLLSSMVMNVDSRGRVTLSNGVPRVDFNVLSTDGDRKAMRRAVRGLVSLVSSPGFAAVADRVSIDADGTSVNSLAVMSESDLDNWIDGHVEVASHATSSCARAVDSSGLVVGGGPVWIADASILPAVPNCTPAAPVTMEARRIARGIRDVLSSGAGT